MAQMEQLRDDDEAEWATTIQAQINADGGASVAQMEQLRDADEAEEDQEEMNGAAQSHASAEGVWDYDNGADAARYYDSDGSYHGSDTESFHD